MYFYRTTRSIDCDEYIHFSSVDVVIHHSLAEETEDDVTKLYIYIYVILPEGVVRSPFRDTEYVIPRDTLKVIVTDNRDSIGALIRDAVYEVRYPLSEAWKELAISLLVILLVITSVVLLVAIATHVYKHCILNRKNAVIPFQIEKTWAMRTCHNQNLSVNSPSSSNSSHHHPTHDGCSLMNVSSDSTECDSSMNGRESASSIHANDSHNWIKRN